GGEWLTLSTGPEPGAAPGHVAPQQVAYVTSRYADNPARTWALPTEKISSAAQAQVLDSVLGSGGRIANAKYGLASERTGQFTYFDSLSEARDAARAAGAKDEVFIVHDTAPAGADIVDLQESGLITSSARGGRVTSMWADSSVAPEIALPPN